MPTLQLSVSYNDNSSFQKSGNNTVLFSPSDFKELYLWGIPLCNPITQKQLSDDTITQKILASQKEVEDYLNLKLFKQKTTETRDFVREEFQNWGFIKTNYPVNKICGVKGRFNETDIISYPIEWLSRKLNNDGSDSKNISIIPNGGSGVMFSYYSISYPTLMTFRGMNNIPNYWLIDYVTGFDNIPEDLMEFVGMLTAIKILPLIELTVGGGSGSSFGLSNQSLSIDGLSQSVGKINGGNIFQNRLKTYAETLTTQLIRYRSIYTGIMFEVF